MRKTYSIFHTGNLKFPQINKKMRNVTLLMKWFNSSSNAQVQNLICGMFWVNNR